MLTHIAVFWQLHKQFFFKAESVPNLHFKATQTISFALDRANKREKKKTKVKTAICDNLDRQELLKENCC